MTPDERDMQAGVLGMLLGSFGTQYQPKAKGFIRRVHENSGLLFTLEVGRDGLFYELELQVISANKITKTG